VVIGHLRDALTVDNGCYAGVTAEGECRKFVDWRARLEADGGGLENRYECKLIKGSNPLPSAMCSRRPFPGSGRRPDYGPVTDLLDYCAGLPVRLLAAGEALIDEGVRHDGMWVLVSGSVSVERDGVPFARVNTPGAVFGEMSVVLDRVATATVRARSDVEVYLIADPLGFLREKPGAALEVLRVTAARLDGLTQYLVDVKQQYADRDDHLGMVDGILDVLVHHHPKQPRTGSVRDPEAG
jgi:CRP/FNR family cyclic AMP-dependent transcriptional regulator